ncbi:ribosomal protein S18-alanine N-acetyltransferase [Halomonas nitroreducens]|uniref:[Ribosomal protein bS18]-alanine N-acetyltransferase n=1 Tax=Halomonas nitroreducens TaxID=447425 RepID=A0A431V3K7_9GAMM|nr:ribosomal protein S18-alanine N-acetyltransferase [Halomonas nitroreducens]RTR03370.1 ribosomal-protein-alanine N-acetyltransferase [Halomonas nitroreducens]
MPERRLRRLTGADLVALDALERAGQGQPWPTAQLQAALASPDHAVLGVEAAELVGHAVVARQPFDAELETILVAPAHRGRGLAGMLLRGVIEQAQDWGCERLLLEVRASNAPAIALYRRAGLVEDGRRRGYYPPLTGTVREDALLMSRPLGGA